MEVGSLPACCAAAAVWIPDQEHEALRNLVRVQADAKVDQLRAEHRLSKFLLRQGCQPPVGVRNWSKRYFEWLRQLEFEQVADQVVFADYLAEATAAGERVKRLEAALRSCAPTTTKLQLIRALQAFRGIGFLSAVIIVAEAGDLRRFATAPQFMAFEGLQPSYSDGVDGTLLVTLLDWRPQRPTLTRGVGGGAASHYVRRLGNSAG